MIQKLKANFYWIDERCVNPYSEESNYKSANDYLFKNINIDPDNINRIIGENNPEKEVKRYSNLLIDKLRLENGLPSLDLAILGIGDDGHTASIFPYELISECLSLKQGKVSSVLSVGVELNERGEIINSKIEIDVKLRDRYKPTSLHRLYSIPIH